MAEMPASEFGGKVQKNTIQPPVTPLGHPGHTDLDAAEKLRLQYLTGQPGDMEQDSTRPPDNGEAFTGILTRAEQEELMPKPPLYSEKWR